MLIKALLTITVPAGTLLLLSDEQRSARAHALSTDDSGVSRLLSDQQFKAGEELNMAGDVPICIQSDRYEVLEADAGKKKSRKSKAEAAETGTETTVDAGPAESDPAESAESDNPNSTIID